MAKHCRFGTKKGKRGGRVCRKTPKKRSRRASLSGARRRRRRR